MKITKLSFILSAAVSLIFAFSAFAQTETFSDPNVDYTFEIPDTSWKMTAKPSNISPNVEYVYGTRQDGHLEVRKLSIKSGDKMEDIVRDGRNKTAIQTRFCCRKRRRFQRKSIRQGL